VCTPNPVVLVNGTFGNVTCTLTATMTGTTAPNVRIIDMLPRGATFLQASAVTASGTAGSCSGTRRTTCTVGDLGPGQSATATIVYRPTTATTVVNTGCVVSNFRDPQGANNCDQEPEQAVKVDLIIHRSSTEPCNCPGPAVSEANEETIGAFAVANINDTNGNGVKDRDEAPVLAVPNRGRNEVDLMALDVIVTPGIAEGTTIRISVVSGDAVLWKTPFKEGAPEWGVPTVELCGPCLKALWNQIWVEARNPSVNLRDIVIRAEYMGASDTVRATGVWSEIREVAHFSMTAEALFSIPEWSDVTDPPKSNIIRRGGVGLRPITNQVGVQNVILMQFKLSPAGIGSQPGVQFDVTRQKERKEWFKTAGSWLQTGDDTFPLMVELPNDDEHNNDESPKPTAADNFYVYDSPGHRPRNAGNSQEYAYKGNFLEFIRVRFDGNRPTGNRVMGSRASAKFAWHGAHRLVNQGGVWVRSTGDFPEVIGVNSIDPGHIVIGNAP
jgi:hypothetical protein